MNIRELVATAYRDAHRKGWHDRPRTFGDCIALIHSELSEALEAYRAAPYAPGSDNPYMTGVRRVVTTGPDGPDGKPEGVASELADVLIRIADMCGELDIDLEAEVLRKLEYNRTRPYRHGGKRL